MPKIIEEKLRKEAIKLHLNQKRQNAYVYGTMRKMGWIPSTQKNGGK